MNLDAVAGIRRSRPDCRQADDSNRRRIPTASTAARAVARHENTNGAPTPCEPIIAPPTAAPAARPASSAAVTQVNASVSLPGVTARPTNAYWQENTGANASGYRAGKDERGGARDREHEQ